MGRYIYKKWNVRHGRHFSLGVIILGLMMITDTPAFSGEVKYAFTDDFVKMCNHSNQTFAEIDAKFVAADWSDNVDNDLKDAFKPDDYLRKIKNYKVYENASPWYGVVASGKLAKLKVHYCALNLLSGDIDDMRQDLERAIGQTASDIVKNGPETRYIYLKKDDTKFFMVREMPVDEETKLLILSKVTTATKKGK